MAPSDERYKDDNKAPDAPTEQPEEEKKKQRGMSVLFLILPIAAIIVLTLGVANWKTFAQWLGQPSCPTCPKSTARVGQAQNPQGGVAPEAVRTTTTVARRTTTTLRAAEAAPMIKVEELKTRLDKGEDIKIYDVRAQSSYETDHITGSLSLPLGEITDRYKEVPRDPEVVLYCACPNHTAIMAYRVLAQHGYENVKVLEEGIGGWRLQGYPVEKG